jgi:hypothetical protein
MPALQARMDSYISKPLLPSRLFQAVENIAVVSPAAA